MMERDKLTGAFLNNLAAASVIFGMIRPMIEGVKTGLPSMLAMIGWVVIGLGTHWSARQFAKAKE